MSNKYLSEYIYILQGWGNDQYNNKKEWIILNKRKFTIKLSNEVVLRKSEMGKGWISNWVAQISWTKDTVGAEEGWDDMMKMRWENMLMIYQEASLNKQTNNALQEHRHVNKYG